MARRRPPGAGAAGSCYRKALQLAQERALASIAFPSISTGIYGYPLERAAPLAVATVREFVKQDTTLQRVVFCCFSDRDLAVYQGLLQAGA